MHRVEDHMQRRVIELRADAPLRCAIETMLFQRSVHGCVLEDGRLIGILSDHDVRRALPSPLTGFGWAEYELALGTITVGQAMTRCPTTVTPATPMREAVYMMLERSIRALPVVSHDRVVGILTDEICMAAYLAALSSDACACAVDETTDSESLRMLLAPTTPSGRLQATPPKSTAAA